MQNQAIFELCTDDNKSKYSSNPKGILKSAQKKKKKKKIYIKQKSTATTTTTTEFLSKIPDRRKISNEQFNLFQAEISFDVS